MESRSPKDITEPQRPHLGKVGVGRWQLAGLWPSIEVWDKHVTAWGQAWLEANGASYAGSLASLMTIDFS